MCYGVWLYGSRLSMLLHLLSKPAQVTPLMRMPQRVSSCPAPDGPLVVVELDPVADRATGVLKGFKALAVDNAKSIESAVEGVMNTADDKQESGPELPWRVAATASGERPVASDLVLAWARDSATGAPRFVCELGPERNGKHSGCECYSCGRQLLAINNTKRVFRTGEKRPHFRHPEGTAKESCLVLSARAAALQMLLSQGYLELPSRRRSSVVSGLSGTFYEAWVEQPPERVRFRNVEIRDQARALLTLDDGRVLEVVLTGLMEAQQGSESGDSALVPSILLVVDDPHIAAMSPEVLRARLELVVENGGWCRHWHDAALQQQAEQAALDRARESLDWLNGDYMFPDETGADEKRETLLHVKAKEILEREKRLTLPQLVVTACASLSNGKSISEEQVFPSEAITLEGVELERPMGRIRPDVWAHSRDAVHWPAGPLLIEVTVTNSISNERLERIRAQDLPAIEIDVSRMGGRVTEAEFAKLILDEVAAKRWLHHPREKTERARLRELLDCKVEAALQREVERAVEARRLDEIHEANLDQCRLRFLAEAERYYALRHLMFTAEADHRSVEDVSNALQLSAEALARDFGFPEAREVVASTPFSKILERIISIWSNCCPGNSKKSVGQLLSDIRSEQPHKWQWHTIYLIAVRIYKPTLTAQQADMVEAWRKKALKSLREGEGLYIRSSRYDRLLATLFPEMADMLNRPLPTNQAAPDLGAPAPAPAPARPQRGKLSSVTGVWLDNVILNTANHKQWEACGARNWKTVLEMGKDFRNEGISVLLALQQCACTADQSEALIFGIWMSAGLAKSPGT